MKHDADYEKKVTNLFKWDKETESFVQDPEEVAYGQLIDLSEEGERWEGSSLRGHPFGYGCLFDTNGHPAYLGVMFEEKKECYGEEYYEGNGIVEYRGTFMNGLRHGWGSLYNIRGELLYEGNWVFGNNELFVLNIKNSCDEMV